MKPYLFPLMAAVLLAACATAPQAPAVGSKPVIIIPPQPRPPKPAAPPQANAEWVILGVSPSGNVLHELDKLSIRRQGVLTLFRDRKTIFNPKKENFLGTPRHKQSLNSWEVDCVAATYRLAAMSLLDESGREILNRVYNDSEIRPMPVVRQSASFQQVDYVCKQLN